LALISNCIGAGRLERLVEALFSLSDNVRYVEVFDSRGVVLAGGIRSCVRSLDPPKTAAKIDTETARYALTLMAQRRYYGALKYMWRWSGAMFW